jgi:hypothetical protein
MQTNAASVPHDTDGEYRAIEATLLQTARGRWFLSEHGRRARRLDSVMLEEAMVRLQSSLRDPPALLGQLKTEIEKVKSHLAETRGDIAKRAPVGPAPFGGDPGNAPPQGILTAAEDIHELAWSLQAKAPDAESCEQIARHAARLYAMSLQQAIESARLAKLAGALDEACAQLAAILETIGFETAGAEGKGEPVALPPATISPESPSTEQALISSVLASAAPLGAPLVEDQTA